MFVPLWLAAVVGVAAFVAGLLVGRRNPKVADIAANVANQAQDAAKKL